MTVTVIEGAADPSPVLETATPEVVADAAVEVAQIQADRDVSIAEINAATTETIIQAQADEDDLWLRNELGTLSERLAATESLAATQSLEIAAMSGQIADMAATILVLTTPPSSSETVPETGPETGAETGASPEEGLGTGAPAGQKASPEAPKESPLPVRAKRVWL